MIIYSNFYYRFRIQYSFNDQVFIAQFNLLYSSLSTLQWRQNEHDGVSNHQPRDCLLNRLFKAQIKENIKVPRHWPLQGEFTGDRWTPRTKGQ